MPYTSTRGAWPTLSFCFLELFIKVAAPPFVIFERWEAQAPRPHRIEFLLHWKSEGRLSDGWPTQARFWLEWGCSIVTDWGTWGQRHVHCFIETKFARRGVRLFLYFHRPCISVFNAASGLLAARSPLYAGASSSSHSAFPFVPAGTCSSFCPAFTSATPSRMMIIAATVTTPMGSPARAGGPFLLPPIIDPSTNE